MPNKKPRQWRGLGLFGQESVTPGTGWAAAPAGEAHYHSAYHNDYSLNQIDCHFFPHDVSQKNRVWPYYTWNFPDCKGFFEGGVFATFDSVE
jgi:hypothetical protein